MIVTTPILPSTQYFVGSKKTLDYEAICVFLATGFFLDDDSFYKEQKVLQPGRHYEIDEKFQQILSVKPYFKWHYTPNELSFDQTVEAFGNLFETIIAEQIADQEVILPLSGGLDSRTQAVALYRLGLPTQAYSYAFEGGHDETWYGKRIAETCNFPFKSLQVPKGYLWQTIEELASINACYSEFTHPRQMAFIEQYATMGDVFSLGHWGDVLFDDMNVADDLALEDQVVILYKKVIKKQGLILAEQLWKSWELAGNFKSYLTERLTHLLKAIGIPHNANAQIRAFKSLYWAPRWTSVNLSIFEQVRPIHLPYYDNRMCEFICTVPEKYLAGRQIQIAYIKKRMPELAKLAWQEHRPFNLNSYQYNKIPYNLPYRVFHKLRRSLNSETYIQRNWELQFLGATNDTHLKSWLFEMPFLSKLVPDSIVAGTYKEFVESDGVHESHAVSMLLTLALFVKREGL